MQTIRIHSLQFQPLRSTTTLFSSVGNWKKIKLVARESLTGCNILQKNSFVTIPPNFAPPPKDFEVLENITEWLEENDGLSKNCFVGIPKTTNRRGLFTRNSASPGDVLLKIPNSFIIGRDKIMADPIGPLLPWPSPTDMQSMGDTRLRQQMLACFGLYLLKLKHERDNYYYPWIQVLPSKVFNCLDFPESLLKELNNTSVGLITQQMRADFDRTWELLSKKLFPLYSHAFPSDIFTKDGLRWGINMAWSRAINSESGPLMVPVMDFANHPDTYRGQNSHFSPAMENGELIGVLTATKFIKPNQEIFVDYGARSNSALFNVYGFTQDNNPEDELFLKISTFTLQLNYYQHQNFGEFMENTEDFVTGPNQMIIQRVDQSIESLIDPLRSLWIWKNKSQYPQLTKETPFPSNLEKEFLNFVINVVNDEMERFKTTIQQDEELLKDQLDPMMRNTVKMRMSEKRIFQNHLDSIKELKQSLT